MNEEQRQWIERLKRFVDQGVLADTAEGYEAFVDGVQEILFASPEP